MEIFTTMITPFGKDGSVDLDTALRYVDWYYENGLDGIFAICQSSEIFFLDLRERIELNRAVYARAKELEKRGGRPFTVVSSGHVSDAPGDQERELLSVAESGTDALILITNRLDPANEGDDVFLRNAERLLAKLPSGLPLGLYECPYPYKRLVTPRILSWCTGTGRFRYMKDTCCDARLIGERTKLLKGSGFRLLNANCQTLLETMKEGADGYCGIMCNFHPRLYAWLRDHWRSDPVKAEAVGAAVGMLGFTEGGLPYPLTAKYSMTLSGIPTEFTARSRPGTVLSRYDRDCVEKMKLLTDRMERELGVR